MYCAKYLHDIIKDQKAYKERKLQKALGDAFMAIDAKLTTEEVIKEMAQIAGQPTEVEDEKEKVADEDDVDNEETALLHEEATMTIEELLMCYGQNCHKGSPHSKSGAGTGEEPGSQGLNGEAGPEDPSRETSSEENGPTAKAHMGLSSNSECGTEAGQGGEPGTLTGEAGPSYSSDSDKLRQVAKSKFLRTVRMSQMRWRRKRKTVRNAVRRKMATAVKRQRMRKMRMTLRRLKRMRKKRR